MGANAQTSVPAFTAGQVLTAAQVTGINTGIPVFASSTERDAAFGGTGEKTLAEGQMAYLEDTNATQYYDGSSWAAVAGGKILAVKHALFTGTQTNSTASAANFAVTDLSITHTLADSSNILIISAYFGAAGSSTNAGRVGIAVANDGTLVNIADTAGSRTLTSAWQRLAGTLNTANIALSICSVYAPGDTSSHTYTVRAINMSASTQTVYINRTPDDQDQAQEGRATSGLVIQEVSA